MIYVEVAVAAPLEHLLTYKIPSEGSDCLIHSVQEPADIIGRRILVPLSNRKVTGYIVAVCEGPVNTDYKIRKIVKFLDDHVLFHPEIVPFYQWIAGYYHYPVGLVIKAALPGGLASKSVKILQLTGTVAEVYASFSQNPPSWATRIGDNGQLSAGETARLLADKKWHKDVEKLSKNNIVGLKTTLQKDVVAQKSELCFGLASELLLPIRQAGDPDKIEIKRFQQQLEQKNGLSLKFSEAKTLFVLDQLSCDTNNEFIALKDLRNKYSGATKQLESLVAQALVISKTKRVFRNPFGNQLPYYPPPEKLSVEQTEVVAQLHAAIHAHDFKPFLLHGVTGSGKTEVYLRAAEQVLKGGEDVLIIVPEIGLASGLEAHFTSRFGANVVLQHSGMTRAVRFDQYCLALSGKAKIVIGARSAIFAPLKNLGLIVVDEEHDQGFKQDDSFRYNGRDLAIVRAKLEKAVAILGSATPSVVSYANATEGKYGLLCMSQRIGKSIMPQVRIIDLNSADAKQDKAIIKKELRGKIESNLADGKQTLLLINRRGFSSAYICRDCGTPVQCNHCHISLTLHRTKKRLICHYCGFSLTQMTQCAECRSKDLTPAGIGSERVEAEVLELFPQAVVQRLDSDIVSNRKTFHDVLRAMHEGDIDILIGTQMIAKGHHFPNVTLVGVVWADGGMNMPDFRAAERTFQLLTQVIGRAGRGDYPGDVVIQTMRPEHYSIVYSKKHDYSQLFEREMELRKAPLFPPYVRLTVLHIKGPVEKTVQQGAIAVAKYCRKAISSSRIDVGVLGPAPSPLDKIKDNYRWQVLLKGKTSSELKTLCDIVKNKQNQLVPGSCRLIIDVDPENLM